MYSSLRWRKARYNWSVSMGAWEGARTQVLEQPGSVRRVSMSTALSCLLNAPRSCFRHWDRQGSFVGRDRLQLLGQWRGAGRRCEDAGVAVGHWVGQRRRRGDVLLNLDGEACQ